MIFTGSAKFQTNAASEAEGEAARLRIVSGSFAAARGAISGMVENCEPFMAARTLAL